MIFGIGTDITKVSRFEKWIKDSGYIERFFADEERCSGKSEQAMMEHYAARFAAKEAFSKAIGTGLVGFDLKEVFIQKNQNGKPELIVRGKAENLLKSMCNNPVIHVSLSHEKEYALAYVVIEQREE